MALNPFSIFFCLASMKMLMSRLRALYFEPVLGWGENSLVKIKLCILLYERGSLSDDLLSGELLQQYFSRITATDHKVKAFFGFHQHYARVLKCLAHGHSHDKPIESSMARTQN